MSYLVGLVSGIALLIWGMGIGTLSNFFDPQSIAIVFGGVVASVVMSFPPSAFKDIPKHFKIIFSKKKTDPNEYIAKLVDYAQEARRKGLLTLEDKANEEEDEFLKNSIMLIVDAIEPTKVKEMLENELNCLEARHAEGRSLYEKAAVFAPAFGMIGTLIGLINMLKAMGNLASGDAASGLGDSMSVALVTTFYGSVIANLLLMPISHRLKAKHNEEMLCKEIIVEGVLAIHAGTNPRHIEERLKAFVRNSNRVSVDEMGSGSGDGESGKKEKKSKKSKK